MMPTDDKAFNLMGGDTIEVSTENEQWKKEPWDWYHKCWKNMISKSNNKLVLGREVFLLWKQRNCNYQTNDYWIEWGT